MRDQYTITDDATRIRALKIYDRHTQANAVDLIDTVIAKFPFRIREVRTDQQEFYQLLSYKGDIGLKARLDEWEKFYNLARPHGAFKGKASYEILRERL